jgi:hypothetical protein
MPTFIPARGRTLHLAGVCVNRIGTESFRALAKLHPSEKKIVIVDDLHIYGEDLGQVLSSSWSRDIVIVSSAPAR